MNTLYALVALVIAPTGIEIQTQSFKTHADCVAALAEVQAAQPTALALCVERDSAAWSAKVTVAELVLASEPEPDPEPEPEPNPTTCDVVASNYDPANFDRVLEEFEATEDFHLSGSEWDNTLIRNCRIHDTGGDGIFIKNASNVVIQNCEIWNVYNGIKTSSEGSTESVIVDGNYVHDVEKFGIHSGQRVASGVDHPGFQVLNNRVETTGSHGIYVQSQDVLVEGNTVANGIYGNAISIRSSGVVRCNNVSGTIRDGKAAIRYYSDHQHGATNTLVIERNVVDDPMGIQLYALRDRYDGQDPPDHVVKNFVINNNTLSGGGSILVDDDYTDPIFSVDTHDNSVSD